MTFKRIIFLAVVVAATFQALAQNVFQAYVPVGGNSWVTTGKGGKEKVTNDGWQNWNDVKAEWSTYVKVQRAGAMNVKVLLSVPAGSSSIAFVVRNKTNLVKVTGAVEQWYNVGSYAIDKPGYVCIKTKGISKTGNEYAVVKALQLEGTAIDSNTAWVKNNEGNYFYWGRRGPSVHINYDITDAGNEAEWFYNEITVPPGNDVIGSYFMADGFAEGYFGMQVNSATERRIIFSVWSPFNTDNSKEVPVDKKIILVKKGQGVDAGEFGNEGSGGHSHLVYNWKVGQTYRFLLRGYPVENNYTNYTAWFFDNEKQQWILIASFSRPATTTYLKRFHSFLENFIPETGNITRKAYYHNQWVKPAGKDWVPVDKMTFTADATARKGYRMDYNGGVENGMFFLQNAGFFNETGEFKKIFTVNTPTQKPDINLSELIK